MTLSFREKLVCFLISKCESLITGITMKIKKQLTIFLIFALFVCPEVYSQDDSKGEEIAKLIRKGDARELARNFNVSVQLTLPENEGRFSRTQAEMIIRDFFSKHPPKSFSINHQGASSDGSRYYIGVYKTTSVTFRSYFLLKQVADKALIHQLRFEDDD
jgi:hypothetical protein